jgi:hypothetical protein
VRVRRISICSTVTVPFVASCLFVSANPTTALRAAREDLAMSIDTYAGD